jgi:hypothetical protein
VSEDSQRKRSLAKDIARKQVTNRAVAIRKRNSATSRVVPGKVEVTFGDVSVVVKKPTNQAIQEGVAASAKVITKLGRRLLHPGISISYADDVPVFTADPTDPQRVVRILNGKSESGHFGHGKFKVDKARPSRETR